MQVEKKRAIVQQTIGITDNVDVHQYVHYRPACICTTVYTAELMGLGVN